MGESEESKSSDYPRLRGKLLRRGTDTTSLVSSRLKGTLITQSRLKKKDQEILSNKAYLQRLKSICEENGFSYSQLLGGLTPLSMNNAYHLSLSKDTTKKFLKTKVPFQFGFGSYLNTGVDYNGLLKCSPHRRYKFYISFLLNTEEKRSKAEQFVTELFEYCVNNQLSIGYKVEDHNYDSFNLYTWDIEKLEQKISELYEKYESFGIFSSVHHFFQRPINGVNPMHIGVVNEPILGFGGSHSTRMMELGKLIDKGIEFEEACKIIGVLPESPWEVNWENEEISRKYREKFVK